MKDVKLVGAGVALPRINLLDSKRRNEEKIRTEEETLDKEIEVGKHSILKMVVV